MPKAWLSELGEKLPQIALAMLAAKRGGPEASAAFMSGLQESADRRQVVARQAQLDEERRGAQAQQLAFQARQEARQGQQDARQSDLDARGLAQEKYQRVVAAVNLLSRVRQEQETSAPDALSAEQAISRQASMLERAGGMEEGTLFNLTPSMGPAVSAQISARNRREAEAIYNRAEKRYGPEAMATDNITLRTGETFGDVKPSQLRAIFESPAIDETGQPAPLARAMPGEVFPGTSEHAGRTRILRDEFVANHGRDPNAAERRAIDDQANKDTVTPIDPEIAALRKDILRDQASRPAAQESSLWATDPKTGTTRRMTEAEARASQATQPSSGGQTSAQAATRDSRVAAALNDWEQLKRLVPTRRPGPLGIAEGMGRSVAGAVGLDPQAATFNRLVPVTAMKMAVAIQGAANLSDRETQIWAQRLGSMTGMDYETQMNLLNSAGADLAAGANVTKAGDTWVPASRAVKVVPGANTPGSQADPLGIRR